MRGFPARSSCRRPVSPEGRGRAGWGEAMPQRVGGFRTGEVEKGIAWAFGWGGQDGRDQTG